MEKAEKKKMMGKANPIFEKINDKLSSEYKGKMIAIEVESGDYFMGNTGVDAIKIATKKYPNKIFVLKRIGFETAYRVLKCNERIF